MPEEKINRMSRAEAAVVSRILGIYRSYWSSAHNRMRLFEDLYATYRFYRDPYSHTYKYNVSKPIALTFVQQYISNIVNIIFERDKIIHATPINTKPNPFIGVSDMSLLSQQIERAVNGAWNLPDTNFFLSAYDWFFDQSTYGVAYITTLPRFVDETDTMGNSKRRYVGPNFGAQDVLDVVPNPWISTVNDGDKFLKEVVSWEELQRREKQEGYKNIAAVKDNNYISEDLRRELFTDTAVLNMIDYAFDQFKKHNKILLLHYFDKGHITTIASNKTIVKSSREPRTQVDEVGNPVMTEDGEELKAVETPYSYDIWDSLSMNAPSREIFGIGIAEIARQFQNDANLRASQRFENIELAIQKVMLVNTLFDIDPDDLIFGAGNVIRTNDINNSLKVFEMGNITQDWYTEDALDKATAEEAAGTMPINRGHVPGGRTTATTATIASRGGLGRQSMNLRRVDVLFRNLAIKTLIQMKDYWTKEEYEAFIGEEDAGLYNMSIEDLKHSINIRISASALDLTRDQTNQALMQLYQQAVQLPFVNAEELTREAFRRVVSDVNPDKFISPVPTPTAPPQGQNGQQPPGAQNQIGSAEGNAASPGLGLGNLTPDQLLNIVEQGGFNNGQ